MFQWRLFLSTFKWTIKSKTKLMIELDRMHTWGRRRKDRFSAGTHNGGLIFRVLHFLPTLPYFSRFTSIFTEIIFPVLVLSTPGLAVFMLWTTLLTPIFCSFIFWAACGVLVMRLSLRGNDLGTQQPTKIGSPFFWITLFFKNSYKTSGTSYNSVHLVSF